MAVIVRYKNGKNAGKPVLLTSREQKLVDVIQRQVNNLGYEVQITTLTQVVKRITEQKFFEVAPAKYLPVRVGQGAWSSNLTTFRSFNIGDNFETGLINNGGQSDRLAGADAAIDSVNILVNNWAKKITWTLFELEQASRSGNWDLISQKERARKKNWDLGVQRIAFLGARGLNGVGGSALGLLNQGPAVTVNTSVITMPISQMSVSQLKTFCATVYEAYRSNCNRTAVPSHFIVPESDYNGMASQASADFPIKSVKTLLEETFCDITQRADFKILPLSYADQAYHTDCATIAGKQVYTMLNYDEESIRMDVPVDYTNTLANSTDNFSFQNVGYGQVTGVLAYRPLEMLYFQY